MTPYPSALQVLLKNIEGWRPVIERSTGGKMQIYPIDRGFNVVICWTVDGRENSYVRPFQEPIEDPKACNHARSIIREVLERRGVIT